MSYVQKCDPHLDWQRGAGLVSSGQQGTRNDVLFNCTMASILHTLLYSGGHFEANTACDFCTECRKLFLARKSKILKIPTNHGQEKTQPIKSATRSPVAADGLSKPAEAGVTYYALNGVDVRHNLPPFLCVEGFTEFCISPSLSPSQPQYRQCHL